MTIVITMAGLGSRFWEAGYTIPKYMIDVNGKSIFEWSMLSLSSFISDNNKWIFITRAEDHKSDFIKSNCNRMGIKQLQIIEIHSVTDGQATTALLAAPHWQRESELLIYNIDTYVEPGEIKPSDLHGDGFIPCFNGDGDHWSFVALNREGNVSKVAEKDRISNNCTIGAYYFRTCKLYEKLYKDYYRTNKHLVGGEKYIAPLYNQLINTGGEVYISMIRKEKVHILGTPKEVENFKRNCKNE